MKYEAEHEVTLGAQVQNPLRSTQVQAQPRVLWGSQTEVMGLFPRSKAREGEHRGSRPASASPALGLRSQTLEERIINITECFGLKGP